MNFLRKLAAAAALAGLTSLASAAGYTGLYIFGDSLSDTGNIDALIGRNANQVISSNAYIPSQPYALGQFSNANVWAKSFANSLGLSLGGLPSGAPPNLLGGTDFAFGGARTSTDGQGLPPSLLAQTNLFLGLNGSLASPNALFVVAGGGNDARDALQAAATAGSTAGAIAAINNAAAAYAQSTGLIVDKLQQAGAKHIIVWDVPNLALAPAVTAQGAGAVYLGGQTSAAMNYALGQRLTGEAGVTVFDLFGLQSNFVTHAADYGLTNVTDACGASANCNPSTYLYWDGIHPTSRGHELIAQQMLLVTAAVPEPATWALLVAGLVLVSVRARRRV